MGEQQSRRDCGQPLARCGILLRKILTFLVFFTIFIYVTILSLPLKMYIICFRRIQCMKYTNSVKEEFTQRTITPPPPHRNTRNYLLFIALSLLVCGLFLACPVYTQPYFEIPLKNPAVTNIQIEGEYVPKKGEKLPILLYYLDNTFDYGCIDDTGTVVLDDKKIVNTRGKIFYRLYLRDAENSILLGRKFDESPIRFKLDAQGKLQFRDAVPTPIDTVEEFIRIGLNNETQRGSYLLTNELDMLGSPARLAPRLNWAPIGMTDGWSPPADKFTGIFDGGGKEIWNLYINRTSGVNKNIGLFGYVEAAVLKNIIIRSGSVQGSEKVGGIAGNAASNNEISGCSNAAEVTAEYSHAGGVAGYSDYNNNTITRCSNTGNVTAGSCAGGVAGSNTYGGAISDCSNTGKVSSERDCAGGVAGDNTNGAISDCSNTGEVRTERDFAGGIVGQNDFGNISGCSNTGEVSSGRDYAGGMAGKSSLITDCSNTGGVRAERNYAGGMAGYNWSTITACSNTGAVTANAYYAGGMAGFNTNYGAITACSNTGAVTANANYAGGVAGYNDELAAAITACSNTGAVTANTDYAGGVAGYSKNSFPAITACYNTGAVTSPGANKGGVLGGLSGVDTIECYWLDLSAFNAAANGIGSPTSNNNAEAFAQNVWPGWSAYRWTQSGDEAAGKYWKSLGLWSSSPTDGSKSEFPKLYWQQ
jgi:hypothetical protein